MSENIIAQYEAIIDYLRQYEKYSSSIGGWKGSFVGAAKLTKGGKFKISNLFLLRKIDLLSDKQDLEVIKAIKEVASEEEKKSKFFKIRTSEYIIDALSRELENNFPQVNFAQIRKLYEQQHKKLMRRWNIKHVLGLVFGFGTLVMRTVPKAVITQFGWNYEAFQIYTFWIMIAFIAYVCLAMLPVIIKYYNAKSLHDWLGEILNYTEIRINP